MFRRRSSTESTPLPDEQAVEGDPPVKQSGKGRPTPKRRDSQPSRRPVAPPKDRKEAVRLQRAAAKANRAKARGAMARGDDSALPARDRGPVRRYARDYVDSRRSVAEYFLPIAVVIFLVTMFGGRSPIVALVSSLAFYGTLLYMIVDSVILNRGLKRELARHYPNESTRGISFYSAMRSMQFRTLRFPRPRVRRGETVVPTR